MNTNKETDQLKEARTSETVFREKQAQMSDAELVEKVSSGLSKLCKTGGKSLTMNVPPRVDDFDMLVSELTNRFGIYLKETTPETAQKCTCENPELKNICMGTCKICGGDTIHLGERIEVTETVKEVETVDVMPQSEIEKYYVRCEFDDECDECENPEHGSYAVNLFDGECDSYICGKCATKAIPKIIEDMRLELEHMDKLSAEIQEAENKCEEFIASIPKEIDGNNSFDAVRYLGVMMSEGQKSQSNTELQSLKEDVRELVEVLSEMTKPFSGNGMKAGYLSHITIKKSEEILAKHT